MPKGRLRCGTLDISRRLGHNNSSTEIEVNAMKHTPLLTLDTPEAALCGAAEPYPRPQLQRDSFFSLNGIWEFSARPRGFEPDFTRRIRVPFPPESALSGIGEIFPDGTELYYHRRFTLPQGFAKERVLLHVGAADQVARVC